MLIKLVVCLDRPGEDGGPAPAIGTPAMKSADDALLWLVRQLYEAGKLETCTAMVGMGIDMTVYHFTPEKGFFDPPEGFSFETARVGID